MAKEEILVTIRLNTEGIALPPRIPLSPFDKQETKASGVSLAGIRGTGAVVLRLVELHWQIDQQRAQRCLGADGQAVFFVDKRPIAAGQVLAVVALALGFNGAVD